MNRPKGETAISTGGRAGIDRACVGPMAEEGAKVAILDLPDEDAAALADARPKEGYEVARWKADAADENATKAAIDAAAMRFGGLHIMVN